MRLRVPLVPRGLFFSIVALISSPAAAVPVGAGSPTLCVASTGELPVEEARLLPVGSYVGPAASQSAQAQRFFNQGLVFGWGFNFAEAVRSFRASVNIDPACALCRWGIAWALGPSINHEMQAADVPVVLDAIVQARTHAAADSRERALIDALAQRYSDQAKRGGTERLARAYASAMRALAKRYPADADIAVLAAEAMMNAHAYDYWKADGAPQPWTPQIIAWLDRALMLAPMHPGAHHYRIHLYEESRRPERALASAEQLGALAPVVGHLVHMPSHIFFRLGRYRDAVAANEAAVQADREYAAASGAPSDAVHNQHFWWASALWSGDRSASLTAAESLAATAWSDDRDGTSQHLMAAPVLTRVRFGEWEALAAPTRQHSSARPHFAGLNQFAAGMAFAARGDVEAARRELDALLRSMRMTRAAALTIKNIHRAQDVLNVAGLMLQSAIAAANADSKNAIRHGRAAVRAEDLLAKDDPPVWPVPARHLLGAVLLHAGQAAEAAHVYRADLQRYPSNCTALKGLIASSRAAERKLPTSRGSVPSTAQSFPDSTLCPE